MPIDIRQERPLSLCEAARTLPTIDGRRPHTTTVWRWCRRGVRGVKLEYLRIGRRVCTSYEALGRFAQRLAAADEKIEPISAPSRSTTSRTEQQRQKDIEAAERELDEGSI